MAPGSTSGEPTGDDLAAELDAERAATEHWRRVARQRELEYADLRRRPIVRAALAAERRAEPARSRAATAARALRSAGARAALRTGGLVARLRSAGQRHAGPPAAEPAVAPTLARSVVLVVVGPPGARPVADHERLDGVTVVSVSAAADAGPALTRAVAVSRPDLVGLVLATSEPVESNWLARLAAAIQGPVVAAAPLLVHPWRALASATAHDGMVRAAGLSLHLDDAGVPVVASIASGTEPAEVTAEVEVDAASAAAVIVDAAAFEAAGGLVAGPDLDAAVVELCARLRTRGGHVVVVPSPVVDHRPVGSRRELHTPIDPRSPAWVMAIERSGPRLRRAVRLESRQEGVHFAITVSAPSSKVAERWGDWHMAGALADSLRRRGQVVHLQTADRADDLGGRSCDVHLVLRGLRQVRRTCGQRHVLWLISHPESIEDDELDAADLVLVASARYADHLRSRTATPVQVLLQATDPRRFRPVPPDPPHQHDVTIVAKTRDVLRPVVADALAAGLRPSIYGSGWRGLVDPDLIVADHIDNALLPVVYSSAGVVLNDHWRTMQAWGFVSNRLFDVLACGTPVISDPVPGLAELFGGAVLEYRDIEHLRSLVAAVLADPSSARDQAALGRGLVLAEHTFDHRADELLVALERYT